MPELITTLHPINDETTDLYPNVKNENIPPVVSGKDAMEALEGDFSTLKTDEIQIGGENGTLINKDQIVTQNKVINLDEIVDKAELAQGLNGKVDKVQGKGLSTNDFTDAYKTELDNLPTELNGKVDKVTGKGLSTNDFTNADKNAVEVAIPLRLSFLNTNILDLYRMVIRSGGMITVTDASVALTSQTFPLTVSPKALLNYVGGMCQKVGDSIITAPVMTVISKGFNLWDEEWELGEYSTETGEKIPASTVIRSKNYIPVIPNTEYYRLFRYSTEVVMVWFFYDADHNFISSSQSSANGIIETPPNAHYMTFRMSSQYGNTYNHDICINRSNASMNGTYKPYSAPVYYPIHRNIRALDGYGYGLSDTLYNYIDFAEKKYVKKIVRIDLGSLNYTATPSGSFQSTTYLNDAKKPADNNTKANMLCPNYDVVASNRSYASIDDKSIGLSTTGLVTICDTAYSDATAFKQAMSGVYLYYELATPVETDIYDLLVLTFPTYDIINVIAGGYLEFENENNIGVPYSVTYQYKPDAQTTVQSIAPTAISEVDSNDPTNSI